MGQPSQPEFLIDCALPYWLKGEENQNFGDYLTEFFCARLFYGVGLAAKVTHLIGSVMDDDWLARQIDTDLSLTGSRTTKTVFWGCGLRSETSLSEKAQKQCTILSVRGPLTRSSLRLGISVPIGDPALLLPALHSPRQDAALVGRKALIPHFLDARADAELLALSGCDVVLRPGISRSFAAVEEFIDQVASAEFILAGALHGAIVAAAYGTPFAYWDSGQIDIPFKWRDFSESVGIPCEFHKTVDAGIRHYETEINGALKLPPLLPVLSVAPFPVRQDALVRVIAADIERFGIASLRHRGGTKIQSALAAETWAVPARLIGALFEQSRLEQMNNEHQSRIAQVNAELERSEAENADGKQRLVSLQAKLVDAQSAHGAAAEKLKQFEARNADAAEKLKQFEARNADKEQRLVLMQAKLADAQSAHDAAAEKLKQSESRLAEGAQTIASLRGNVSDALLACDAAVSKVTRLESKAAEAEQRVASMQAQLSAVLSQSAEAEQRIASLQAQLSAALSESAEAEQRIASLQAQLSAALSESDAANAGIAQYKARVAETEAQNPYLSQAQPIKKRSKLRSFKDAVKAIGYIALPYNKRRRNKRKKLMTGLRSY